jgi:hypothetical protein
VTSRPSPPAWAGKHLANPPLRALHRLGLAPRAFAVLETTRPLTGMRLAPVGNGLDGDVFWPGSYPPVGTNPSAETGP